MKWLRWFPAASPELFKSNPGARVQPRLNQKETKDCSDYWPLEYPLEFKEDGKERRSKFTNERRRKGRPD